MHSLHPRLYAGAMAAYGAHWRSGTAAALVIVLGFAGCGSSDDSAKELARQKEIAKARAEGAREARNNARIRKLEQEVRESKREGAPGPAPSNGSSGAAGPSGANQSPGSGDAPTGVPVSGTSCGGDLYVGPQTSCPFGESVRTAYRDRGGGDIKDLVVRSPVTGKDYELSCSNGETHVCIADTDAKVYFK